MKALSEEGSQVAVGLSLDELELINNALNEVCNGVNIPDWEFPTRLGFDRQTARQLLAEVHDLLRHAGDSD